MYTHPVDPDRSRHCLRTCVHKWVYVHVRVYVFVTCVRATVKFPTSHDRDQGRLGPSPGNTTHSTGVLQ